MLQNELFEVFESLLGKQIDAIAPLGGGNINTTFRVKSGSNNFFVKKNSADPSYEILESECLGLALLKASNTIATPEILKLEKVGSATFLILEYIPDQPQSNLFWEKFGRQLAKLHQKTSKNFGLDHSNFIGNLSQQNNYKTNFFDFFIEERMLPQLELAFKNNLISSSFFSRFNQLFHLITGIFPIEPPALIHGDLWNGNFLVGGFDTPILIDPSVSYAHREMDLAMTRLFGGFSKRFYESYHEVYPLQPNFEKRVELYQLYYLMVHVNLFGSSYRNSVDNILKKYTQ